MSVSSACSARFVNSSSCFACVSDKVCPNCSSSSSCFNWGSLWFSSNFSESVGASYRLLMSPPWPCACIVSAAAIHSSTVRSVECSSSICSRRVARNNFPSSIAQHAHDHTWINEFLFFSLGSAQLMRLLRNHKLKLVIGDANSSSILETRVNSHELEDSSPNVHCPPSKLRLIRRRTNKAKPGGGIMCRVEEGELEKV